MVMSWKTGGLLLGIVFFVAVLLVKPIGVSTQFVILDGIVWDAFNTELVIESETSKSGYASTNAYLNKSGGKYAKSVANPVNYSFIFVIAMMVGAALSALARGGVESSERVMPKVWRDTFGNHKGKRYLKIIPRTKCSILQCLCKQLIPIFVRVTKSPTRPFLHKFVDVDQFPAPFPT